MKVIIFKEKSMAHPTKTALKESLKKLLAVKSLEKITISDITSDSGVNRMTFYYHFKDIYDLVEWSIMEDAQNSLDSDLSYKKWQDGLLKIFYAILYNQDFFMRIYSNIERASAEKYINKHMSKISADIVKELTSKSNISEETKMRIAEYYSFCLTAMIICWIEGNLCEKPELLVEYAAALLKKGMAPTLDKLFSQDSEYIN